MTPEQYCQDKAAKSGSSFYYSFLFLPPPQRAAITALYAFCREVDDVVDETSDEQLARVQLHWWREEISRLFAGQPQHPVTRALTPAIADFNLPEEHFLEIIDGMEMDLDYDSYANFSELSLYCHRVASIVGIMAAEIFGFKDRATVKYAHNLGMAFQLTNILRDVHEDLQRGRLYIPRDELEQHGVSTDDLLNGHYSDNVKALLKAQARRARHYYELAFDGLPEADRYPQRSGLIMATIYLATLDEIERDDYQVLTRRVSLTPLRKLWLAWKTARQEKKRFRNLARAA
jgi:phytoene synthase